MFSLKFKNFSFREVNQTPYNRNVRSSPSSKTLVFCTVPSQFIRPSFNYSPPIFAIFDDLGCVVPGSTLVLIR